MTAFRFYLVALCLFLSYYTFVVISDFGINLFLPFFGAIINMTWSGQFNLDFMMMLSLSALWVGWRAGWTAQGLLLAVLAFFWRRAVPVGLSFRSLHSRKRKC